MNYFTVVYYKTRSTCRVHKNEQEQKDYGAYLNSLKDQMGFLKFSHFTSPIVELSMD